MSGFWGMLRHWLDNWDGALMIPKNPENNDSASTPFILGSSKCSSAGTLQCYESGNARSPPEATEVEAAP